MCWIPGRGEQNRKKTTEETKTNKFLIVKCREKEFLPEDLYRCKVTRGQNPLSSIKRLETGAVSCQYLLPRMTGMSHAGFPQPTPEPVL